MRLRAYAAVYVLTIGRIALLQVIMAATRTHPHPNAIRIHAAFRQVLQTTCILFTMIKLACARAHCRHPSQILTHPHFLYLLRSPLWSLRLPRRLSVLNHRASTNEGTTIRRTPGPRTSFSLFQRCNFGLLPLIFSSITHRSWPLPFLILSRPSSHALRNRLPLSLRSPHRFYKCAAEW
ncbi:hypothetical protein OF83DRAFT_367761 [Amylostereum chailletii]|nr:hypothetical protein OF83DRAFT_367761 [Amylostereum chailletii]